MADVSMKDPYSVLGVARSASADEIKRAYRRLARELHPDVNPGDARAESRFKDVTAAYDLLSDPTKRARYDRGEIDAGGNERGGFGFRSSARGRGPGGGPGGGRWRSGGADFDPEEIIKDIFGRTKRTVKGPDVNYTLRVGFVEAAAGTTQRVSLANGRSFDVQIPPGTEDGQTLRMKGLGMPPGTKGGEPGDAYIEVRIDPHPFFTRKGLDVHLDLPVTVPEAVLGAKITVPTIDGPVAMTIPPGSNTGTVLRLKGKGVPERGGQRRGDQYVTLSVRLPERPDPDLVKFVETWERKHPYDVRRKMTSD